MPSWRAGWRRAQIGEIGAPGSGVVTSFCVREASSIAARAPSQRPSPGFAGLDILKDRTVRVSGDKPGAVRRWGWPLDDLATRRLEDGKHRGETGHLDGRRPVAVGGGIASQQQERPDSGQLYVAEVELLRPRLRQLLVERDSGVEIANEHACQDLADVSHARHNRPAATPIPRLSSDR